MAKRADVVSILNRANAILSAPNSPYTNAETRKGVATLLEGILMDTGNYAGYGMLDWMNGGHEAWKKAGEPEDRTPFFGEENRRVYFTHRNLRK